MTAIDKQAAIAALGGPEKARADMFHIKGMGRAVYGGVSIPRLCDLALSALEDDDGRSLLLAKAKEALDHLNDDDVVCQSIGKQITAIDKRTSCARHVLRQLLAAEPAQSAEPAAPAGDDEARIAEWYHQAANQRGAYIDDGRTLMREFLARAVKAEAEVERLRGAQNARAVEELEGIRERILEDRCVFEQPDDVGEARRKGYNAACQNHGWMIDGEIAALRSSPPAAPTGEAPAQGAGDDVLREGMNPLLIYLQRPGETLTDAKVRHLQSVAAELCRRELARGER